MPGGKAAEPHRAGAVVPAEDDMELCITKSSVVDDAQATADEPEHHVRSPVRSFWPSPHIAYVPRLLPSPSHHLCPLAPSPVFL